MVLLDQTDYTVTAPGEYLEHSRHVVKILRHEGRDEGEFALDLDQKEKLLSVHGWSHRCRRHEYELKTAARIFLKPAGFSSVSIYTTTSGCEERWLQRPNRDQ